MLSQRKFLPAVLLLCTLCGYFFSLCHTSLSGLWIISPILQVFMHFQQGLSCKNLFWVVMMLPVSLSSVYLDI